MRKILSLLLMLVLAIPCLSAAESAGTVLARGETFEAVFPVSGNLPGARMLRVSVSLDPAVFEVLTPGEIDPSGRITYLVRLEDGAARGLWVRVLPDAAPGSFRISLTVHTVLGENAALQAVGVAAAPLQVTVGEASVSQAPAPAGAESGPLQDQLYRLGAALDAGRQSQRELTQQMQDALAEAARAREELAGAQEDLSAMSANFAAAKEEALAVKDRLETAQQRLAALVGKIRAAQEIALRLSDELANTRKELYFANSSLAAEAERSLALARRLQELQDELAKKTEESNEKDRQITQLSEDLTDTKTELQLSADALEQMRLQAEETKQALLDAQAALQKKDEELADVQNRLDVQTEAFNTVTAENADLQDKLDQLNQSLAQAEKKNQDLSLQLTNRQTALDEAQAALSALTGENAFLRQENASLTDENLTLQDKNAGLQDEVNKLTASLTAEREANRSLTLQLTDTQQELTNTKADLETVQLALNAKNEAYETLQADMTRVQQKLTETQTALQSTQDQLAALKKQNELLQAQVLALTGEKNEAAYQKAESLFEDRDYEAARAVYASIPGYRDADQKAAACDAAIAARNARLTVGQYVTLGRYPQSASGKDRTPIEWLVLDVKGDKALLLSRRGLDAMPYNTVNGVLDWSACSLRQWLNRDFMAAAFTADERHVIAYTVIVSTLEEYTEGYAFSVDTTRDQVFLLSYAEVSKYLSVLAAESGSARYSVPLTDYAVRRGGNTAGVLAGETGWWWLRLPGDNRTVSAYVMGGPINAASLYYTEINNPAGVVRPAIWVTLKDGALLP